MQSLPVLLLAAVCVVLAVIKSLQHLQSRMFHVVPFGTVGRVSVVDVCASMLLGGFFLLYLGKLKPPLAFNPRGPRSVCRLKTRYTP